MNILDMKPLGKNKKSNKKCYITKLVIEGLFNKFDYEFNFNRRDKISIIIAPNGCGKTTMLNFINFLLYPSQEIYDKIKNVPVKSVKCWTNTGDEIGYERLDDEYISQNFMPEINERMNKYNAQVEKIKKSVSQKSFLPIIDELLKAGVIGATGKNISLENFYYEFYIKSKKEIYKINFLDELNSSYKKMVQNYTGKSLIEDIQKSIVRKLIMLRRCYVEYVTTKRTNAVIDNVSIIQFINRVIEKTVDKQKTMNELEKAKETKKLLSAIDSIGYMTQAKTLISHYLQADKVSKQITSSINLMEKIYNKRNAITNKKIVFSKDNGIEIYQDNKEIPLGCLSSGEINDFAMFFRMIFNEMDPSMFLIDEPEISLHIDWQEDILDWFLQISKIHNRQIILATHSPNIINSHYDLIVNNNARVYGEK